MWWQTYRSPDPVSSCTLKVLFATWIGTNHSMPSVNVVLTDAVSFPPAFNVTCDEESSLTGTASPAPARRDKTKMWEIISTDMSLRQVTATKKELTGVQRKRLIMNPGRGEIAYLRGNDSQSLVMAKEAFHSRILDPGAVCLNAKMRAAWGDACNWSFGRNYQPNVLKRFQHLHPSVHHI